MASCKINYKVVVSKIKHNDVTNTVEMPIITNDMTCNTAPHFLEYIVKGRVDISSKPEKYIIFLLKPLFVQHQGLTQ